MSQSSLADREGGCIGEKFLSLYNGFFSNEDFIDELIQFSIRSTSSQCLTILELGANNGVISLSYKNKRPNNNYIISDFNSEGLVENTSIENKVQCDNKNLPFSSSSVDVVIMRSVLHYEKTEQDIVVVLKEIRRILKNNGVFINQSAIAPSYQDQVFLADIHALVKKNMTMSTHEALMELYKSAGLYIENFQESNFKLKSYFLDFLHRYNCSQEIREAASLVLKKNHNTSIVHLDDDQYYWDINYILYSAIK